MRNLVEYPITRDEMLRAIKRASDDEVSRLASLAAGQVPVGDPHLAALQASYNTLLAQQPHRQIYLDCDGVLADFDKKVTEVFGMDPRHWETQRAREHLATILSGEPWDGSKALEDKARALASQDFWNKLYETPDLFTNLEPMPDAFELYEAVKHLDPIILTGCPRGYWAVSQKMFWRDKYFPGVPMISLASRDKRAHCRPGDILIDDWDRYAGEWESKGGTFILHTSASESIARLKKLGVI